MLAVERAAAAVTDRAAVAHVVPGGAGEGDAARIDADPAAALRPAGHVVQVSLRPQPSPISPQ
jgi:hypothetical protein